MAEGLGFRVQGLGCRVRVLGCGCGVDGWRGIVKVSVWGWWVEEGCLGVVWG